MRANFDATSEQPLQAIMQHDVTTPARPRASGRALRVTLHRARERGS
jgi:hypothetical protein